MWSAAPSNMHAEDNMLEQPGQYSTCSSPSVKAQIIADDASLMIKYKSLKFQLVAAAYGGIGEGSHESLSPELHLTLEKYLPGARQAY